jgi:hypothetical protein
MFQQDLKVTIQQIGAVAFEQGQREQMAGYAASNPLAGGGWRRVPSLGLVWGIAERIDDYRATPRCTAASRNQYPVSTSAAPWLTSRFPVSSTPTPSDSAKCVACAGKHCAVRLGDYSCGRDWPFDQIALTVCSVPREYRYRLTRKE